MKTRTTNQNTQKTSYTGVYTATAKNGELYYRASLTFRRKHISLGSFDTPDKAQAAYLEGLRILHQGSVELVSYSKKSPLSFEKWVSLINFRDNNIYFGTPIYIGQKLFYYYLTPNHVFKFDMDDLFYYSSHKIMKRGGHYFVADYGMQVSLSSRYGIKNYAVEGKDYRFINGDSTDYRRENLEILNSYNGVTRIYTKGISLYKVLIHIKGNYLVGRYKTELEAAIAYNKAIDILHQKGVQKNYTPNYIDGLSPRKYAEIYSALPVSEKLLQYSISQNNQ